MGPGEWNQWDMLARTIESGTLLQLFGEKFHFNAQQLGYQFTGPIIGSVIGAQFGSSISDYWINRETKRTGANPALEYRLWLSYFRFS